MFQKMLTFDHGKLLVQKFDNVKNRTSVWKELRIHMNRYSKSSHNVEDHMNYIS